MSIAWFPYNVARMGIIIVQGLRGGKINLTRICCDTGLAAMALRRASRQYSRIICVVLVEDDRLSNGGSIHVLLLLFLRCWGCWSASLMYFMSIRRNIFGVTHNLHHQRTNTVMKVRLQRDYKNDMDREKIPGQTRYVCCWWWSVLDF